MTMLMPNLRSHRASLSRPRRATQRGLSLIGLLFGAAIVILIAVVVLRVVPSVIEFTAIRGAVEKVASSGASTAKEIQSGFDRFAVIDDIKSISGRDLLIEQVDGGTVVSFSYEKRIELAGPVSLLIHYHGSARN